MKLLKAIIHKTPIQETFMDDIQARFQPHLKDASEAEQLEAVKKNGYAIWNIPNPSKAVQLAAVENKPTALSAIKNGVHFDEEAIKLAISKNGFVISDLENPSEELQLIAVNDHPHTITSIKHPTDNVIAASLTDPRNFLHEQTYASFVFNVKKLFSDNELVRNKWLRYGKKKWETRYDE